MMHLIKVANGITSHYSYNSNDQFISETTADITTIYAWDNNRNLIKKTSPEEEISYSWSSSNKLIAIDDQVNRRQVSYQYDGQDHRIGKITKQNGQIIETQYLVDSERPYSEVVFVYIRRPGVKHFIYIRLKVQEICSPPINELDPSGKFTLEGMMNGINNMARVG